MLILLINNIILIEGRIYKRNQRIKRVLVRVLSSGNILVDQIKIAITKDIPVLTLGILLPTSLGIKKVPVE